jgi:hypothetical protein
LFIIIALLEFIHFDGNFRFHLSLGSKPYASRPVDSSSDRHGFFWVASRFALAKLIPHLPA